MVSCRNRGSGATSQDNVFLGLKLDFKAVVQKTLDYLPHDLHPIMALIVHADRTGRISDKAEPADSASSL